jgi:hypothetical protein
LSKFYNGCRSPLSARQTIFSGEITRFIKEIAITIMELGVRFCARLMGQCVIVA